MATLKLVKTDGGECLLQGTGDSSNNADFSLYDLYDLDGEGGDPFAWANQEWEIVPGILSADYDADDSDTFWEAREKVLDSVRKAGIPLPDDLE
jgi:hypothetical protein